MSINALEKALWQVYLNPADKVRFCTDAQAYLKDFKLDDEERAMSTSFDVMAMIGHGVNPLLVMMAFQTVRSVEKLREYFAIVNQSGGAGSAG